jgi:hypothetical protein
MKFSDKETKKLLELFTTHTRFEIAKILGRSESSIHNKCHKLQLKKGFNLGVYKKGNVPFNKGTKGLMKVNKTSFKKGSIPHNTVHFGKPYLHIRKRRNGYTERVWMIQVDKRRRAYLAYLCELNGIDLTNKVPRFKKEYDFSNVPTLDNFIIISRSKQMTENSFLKYPEEVRGLIRVKAVLTRQINKSK